MKTLFGIIASSIVLITAAAGCAMDERETNERETNERETLAQHITDQTKDLSCDTNAQCKSVGYGNRPCGGYAKYIIYSAKNVNEEALLAEAERYATLDKAHNIEKGMGSICSVETPPEIACINSQCMEVEEQF